MKPARDSLTAGFRVTFDLLIPGQELQTVADIHRLPGDCDPADFVWEITHFMCLLKFWKYQQVISVCVFIVVDIQQSQGLDEISVQHTCYQFTVLVAKE